MKIVLKSMVCMGAVALIVLFNACGKVRSGATGWAYNEKDNGGFERPEYVEQETGPGLILVEGGTFTMGRVEDDVMFTWDNIPRRVTVSSFYMDETEVTNQYWRDYLHWLKLVYGDTYPEIMNKALPDTNIWREIDEFNEPYVNYYLRHPAYSDYPVVGISWLQASEYCAWRTDRVNEVILIREGLLVHNPTGQQDDEHFTTDTYLASQYTGDAAASGVEDFSPKGTGTRNVRMEDGILLPRYRLPTEAEWEYAALGLIGNSFQELITDRRTYPWNGHFVRNDDNGGRFFGTIRANFVRGSGDMMGVAGYLNDNADISAPVYAYPPNDYGLYNMAGNVSEWVMDVYRPLSPEDKSEFRPFRGNVYKTRTLNADGTFADKYDKNYYDIPGVTTFFTQYQKEAGAKLTPTQLTLIDECMQLLAKASELQGQRKDEEAQETMQAVMDKVVETEDMIGADLRDGMSDYIDFVDGDFQSSIYYFDPDKEQDQNRMYEWGTTTLINNRARVYKGGNWRDRAYYTIPGTRRFLDERRSMATLGFRCAMDRLGSPTGIGGKE